MQTSVVLAFAKMITSQYSHTPKTTVLRHGRPTESARARATAHTASPSKTSRSRSGIRQAASSSRFSPSANTRLTMRRLKWKGRSRIRRTRALADSIAICIRRVAESNVPSTRTANRRLAVGMMMKRPQAQPIRCASGRKSRIKATRIASDTRTSIMVNPCARAATRLGACLCLMRLPQTRRDRQPHRLPVGQARSVDIAE